MLFNQENRLLSSIIILILAIKVMSQDTKGLEIDDSNIKFEFDVFNGKYFFLPSQDNTYAKHGLAQYF